MGKKYLKYMSLYFLFNILIFGENIDKAQLDHLKSIGVISQEDYDILLGDSKIKSGTSMYDLVINGENKSKTFEIIQEGNKLFIPLKAFFENIDFTNYKNNNEEITILLGDNLKKIIINLKEKFILIDGKDEKIKLTKENFIEKNGEIYLEENLFKELFLSYIRIDNDLYKMNMTLSFSSPEDIAIRLGRTKDILRNKKLSNELYYTNNAKLFELGYLKVQLDQIYRKTKDHPKYKSDWDGNLEYQGAILYGQLTSSYNMKEDLIGDTYLRYDNIWEKHTLEVGTYGSGYGKSREWGLSFKKDKGYILGSDKTYIIKENVPIGSRVELLYMGIPIAVQDSKNGIVEFENSEIKGDRDYILKIYEPSGKIIEKVINTTSDYNQQNKGQMEYDINLREDESSSKFKSYSNIYYGLTNNLTLGLGYRREPQMINDDYKYIDTGRLEGVYSNYINSLPYTLVLGGDKVFNDIYDNSNNRNINKKYSYDILGQIDIKNIRLKVKEKKSGAYYDEKNRQEYSVKYTLLRALDLHYDYERVEDHLNKHTSNSRFTANYSKTIKDLLVSTEYSTSRRDKDSYGVNFYYNGFRAFTTRWENKWDNDGKDYTTSFSIFNGGNTNLNYTLEASYSEKNKDMFTFRFSMDYENFLNFDFFGDKGGTREFKFGLNRIVDLKNPLEKIDSMDSSRVKVKTFIDLNNNNKFDKGEKPVNNVLVNIGKDKVVTDRNGEGIFYGVPNHITYDLKPTIRKPSFLLGNNKIVIEGRNTSTLTAYIPVKPMITLTGIVNVDDSFKSKPIGKMKVFSNLLVKIKDINGKVIETTMPDETGIFEVSGLFPKKYFIEVTYIGVDREIKGLNRVVQLTYVDNGEDDNVINFNVSKDYISMKEGDKDTWLS